MRTSILHQLTAVDGPRAAADPGVPDGLDTLRRFLDVAATATGRATYYNTAGEQEQAEAAAHQALLTLDRGLYAALVAAPAVTDRTRQLGVRRLLAHPWQPATATLFDQAEERAVLELAVRQLPVPRRLKLFGLLQTDRVNNARARKLILRSILGHPQLERWCVRYRVKLRAALTHAWGQRTTGMVRGVLATPASGRTVQQRQRLAAVVDRYAPGRDPAVVHECVGFILGVDAPWTRPLLAAYQAAKGDLDAGASLPYETLEGIRSTYHRDRRTSAQVLALTAAQLSTTQRLRMQRQADSAGVQVTVDLDQVDAVQLYLYALARGLNPQVAAALDRAAAAAAARFPLAARQVALVLDASASTQGADTQPLRPLAVTLALRDLLTVAAGGHVTEVWCGGRWTDDGLVRPAGPTALAGGLLLAFAADPDVVFLVTDGYENAPAGRAAEVLHAARQLGLAAPVYQLTPVLAAEATEGRAVASEVPVLPVHRAEALELAWVRLLLEVDPAGAARALLRLAAATHDHLEVTP
jgi:hypothetical protein